MASGQLFSYDCTAESTTCAIYPWIGVNTSTVSSFSEILYSVLYSYLNTQGYQLSDCLTNTLYSQWYVNVKIDGTTLINTKFFEGYGIKSRFVYNLSFADLDRELAAGRPVVIGILHRGSLSAPTGGHLLVVIGKKGDDYVVNDPYGSLNDGYTGPVTNGKGAVYKKSDLMQRWLDKGKDRTGWGRIFDAKK